MKTGGVEQDEAGRWYVRPITGPQAVVELELSSEHERDLNGQNTRFTTKTPLHLLFREEMSEGRVRKSGAQGGGDGVAQARDAKA